MTSAGATTAMPSTSKEPWLGAKLYKEDREVNVLTESGANEYLLYLRNCMLEFNQSLQLNRPLNKLGVLRESFLLSVIHLRKTLNCKSTTTNSNTTTTSNLAATAEERDQLIEECSNTCIMLACAVRFCSLEIFDQCVCDLDLESYLNHCVAVLKELTAQQTWISTGVLEQHDLHLLTSLPGFARHSRFVQMAIAEPINLARVVTNLIAAVHQENDPHFLPCPDVTDLAQIFADFLHSTLKREGWTNEEAFNNLESSGLLAQCLRCITQPSPLQSNHLIFLDSIRKCPTFIQKKLCVGQPTGDLLNRVLSLHEGYKGDRDAQVTRCLQNIQAMSTNSSPRPFFKSSSTNDTTTAYCSPTHDQIPSSPPAATGSSTKSTTTAADIIAALDRATINRVIKESGGVVPRVCRHCNKASADKEFQRSLKMCSRCKLAFYCSKECQRADWKLHKPRCVLIDEKAAEVELSVQMTVQLFATKNTYQIMVQLVEAMDHYQLHQSELLLELDFYASSDDNSAQGSSIKDGNQPERPVAPTSKFPPEFKLIPTKNYRKKSCGGLGEVPNWLLKFQSTEHYKRFLDIWQMNLEDEYMRVAKARDRLLIFARDDTGDFGIYRLCLPGIRDGSSIFSDQAVNAFRRYLKHGDHSQLFVGEFSIAQIMDFVIFGARLFPRT